MLLNNPYYYHPQPAARLAADDVLSYITLQPEWRPLFEQGKMLGVLIVEPTQKSPKDELSIARVHYINNIGYLVAYSGVVNGLRDESGYFVPPVYDLQNPDDFYLQKDKAITDINTEIAQLERQAETPMSKNVLRMVNALRERRRQLSLDLQQEIFSHFNFTNEQGTYHNIVDIFAEAKRGLPPGGAGECAAPRLLQYAFAHGLRPLALAEFWYGCSPRKILRIHGHFYPSCIEKCSPILSFMIPQPKPEAVISSADYPIETIFEDEHLLVVVKPKGLLSVPSKNPDEANLEALLHERYPEVKGPMLAHRLDQATSGVMLAAKNAQTHKALQAQFEAKTIHKRYIATVRGKVKTTCGILSLPLTVNPDDRPRQVVDWQYGKPAITYYEVIGGDDLTTTLALYPLTGRTHQLRVHCASTFGLDTPILGDTLYDIMMDDSETTGQAPSNASVGNKNEKCLQLHAESITFVHPTTGEELTLRSSSSFS